MTESTQGAEQVVRAHNELWNEQDYTQIPDVVSESYVEYNPAAPDGEIHGPDGLEEWIRGVTSAFPDLQAELLDVFAEQETVIVEIRFAMTHEGEFAGVPPTGREVEIRAIGKFRVDNGKVTELRNYFDPQELFDQLGVGDESTAGQERPASATTSSDENERLARDHFDRVWNQGEFNTDALADDYRVHLNLGGDETHTLEEFQEFVAKTREAVPDLRKEPEDVVATEDRVTVRYTMTGTQEGEFKGIPGTGQEIEIEAIAVYRIEGGKIAESWLVADFLRAMTQLGVVGSPSEQGDQRESTDATAERDNKAVTRRFFDAWNEADFETIEEVVAADAEQHNPVEPVVPAGPEGEKRLVEAYHSAFPDATLTIEDLVAEGDRVAVRYTATGTHEGEFMGIEPTGNDVEIVGYEINRFEDGRVDESWGLFDAFGLMEQLDVVERPGE